MTADVTSADSLVDRAIVALPDDIRVCAVVELRRWLTERERLTREPGLVADAAVPAHELAFDEAERRADHGDPTAPLWAAVAEAMHLRAQLTDLDA